MIKFFKDLFLCLLTAAIAIGAVMIIITFGRFILVAFWIQP